MKTIEQAAQECGEKVRRYLATVRGGYDTPNTLESIIAVTMREVCEEAHQITRAELVRNANLRAALDAAEGALKASQPLLSNYRTMCAQRGYEDDRDIAVFAINTSQQALARIAELRK